MTLVKVLRPLRTSLVAALLVLPSVQALAACQFNTIASVAFGNYDVFALAATTGVGSIRISGCGGAPFTAALSTGSSGSYVARRMTSGVNTLNYNLYTNATRTTLWGDGSGGTSTMSSNGSTTFTVYGQIPAGQDAAAGAYADVIVSTITF